MGARHARARTVPQAIVERLMSAQALLQSILDDPKTRPRLSNEAQGVLDVLRYLKMDDIDEAFGLVLGMLAGVQERLDVCEQRLAEEREARRGFP